MSASGRLIPHGGCQVWVDSCRPGRRTAVARRALDAKSHQNGLGKGGEEPFKAAFAPS